MKLCDWCQHAQTDQITEKKSIIYGNYLHSHKHNLVKDYGYDALDRALGNIPNNRVSPGVRGSNFGVAAFLLKSAVERQDSHLLTQGKDFRLSGPLVNCDSKRLLISFSIWAENMPTRTTSPTRSTSPMRASQNRHRTAPQIKWVSLPDKVLELLQREAKGKKLSQPEFSSIMVAALGLRLEFKPPVDIAFTIQCFRLKDGGSLKRPNALSGGYPEKFCEVSPHNPFGSTADNRTGKAALPEAVAFLNDLERVKPTDQEYASFIAQFQNLVDLANANAHPIQGRFPGIDYEDLSQAGASHIELMRRLGRSVGPAFNTPCARNPATVHVCKIKMGQSCH